MMNALLGHEKAKPDLHLVNETYPQDRPQSFFKSIRGAIRPRKQFLMRQFSSFNP
jgi:hypothetical protein